MSSQQQTAEQIFETALDCPPEERRAYLDQACPNSPQLRLLVEELLQAEAALGGFLERPLLGPSSDPEGPGGSGGGRPTSPSDDDPEIFCGPRLMAGDLVADRFQVIRFLAHGGMGEIYEVEDRFLQHARVALKIIRPEIASAEGSSRRFEQEVLLARRVVHPNLCPIYDIARSERSEPPFTFLTMKLLAGETLARRLRRREPVPVDEAVSILRQMCAGLRALHDAHVVHRDIKPSNVMLDWGSGELRVVIMDFGLARTCDTELLAGGISLLAGTPGYLAPELLRGETPSEASDVYALGVLMHAILSAGPAGRGSVRKALTSSPSSPRQTEKLPAFAAREFQNNDTKERCTAFNQVCLALGVVSEPTLHGGFRPRSGPLWTRRSFACGAGASALALGGTFWWKHDAFEDMMHPLPGKRFVALLRWPSSPDPSLRPIVSDVIDMIGRELSRIEAFDRDLLIISESAASPVQGADSLREIRDSFGANLLLAASARAETEHLHLSLKVLDPNDNRTLRERTLRVAKQQQTSLAARAVAASAELLGISHHDQSRRKSDVGTDNPEAYRSFLAAEAARKQNTSEGLAIAIPSYKEALSLDPRYARALTGLGWAYLLSNALSGDPAALVLARGNCERALELDRTLVDAHQVLAAVYDKLGNKQASSVELTQALALDPADPHTLVLQARFFEANGRISEAAERLRGLLKLRPNFWLAHNQLGALLNDEGHYAQALTELRAALLAAPRSAVAANNVGSVLLQQGKLDEAEQYLRRSLSISPNDWAASNLAFLSDARQKPDDAVGFARQAVTLNATDPHNYLTLGDALQAHGLQDEALASYEKGMQAAADQLQTNASDGATWMLNALLQAKAKEGKAATASLGKAESLGVHDMDSRLLKLRSLEVLGRRSEALVAMKDCLGRGATAFQMQTLPDTEGLRKDPEYSTVLRAVTRITNPIVTQQ